MDAEIDTYSEECLYGAPLRKALERRFSALYMEGANIAT